MKGIRELREAINMTQKQAAQAAGIGSLTWKKWEEEKTEPKTDLWNLFLSRVNTKPVYTKPDTTKSPTPDMIRQARIVMRMTEKDAADIKRLSESAWIYFETGAAKMHYALWADWVYITKVLTPVFNFGEIEIISPDTIRQGRLKSGLTQKEASLICGAHISTWMNWENGRTKMNPMIWKKFLEYCKNIPIKEIPDDIPSRAELREHRLSHNMTLMQAANIAGVSSVTWMNWENGRTKINHSAWLKYSSTCAKLLPLLEQQAEIAKKISQAMADLA